MNDDVNLLATYTKPSAEFGQGCRARQLPDFAHVLFGQFRRIAPSLVHNRSHRLKVGRIDALPNPAEMIQFLPCRDRTNDFFVDGPVSGGLPLLIGQPRRSVPGVLVDTTLPNPTQRLVATVLFDPTDGGLAAMMAGQEAEGLAFDESVPGHVVTRDRRRLTTPTLAKTGRVGFGVDDGESGLSLDLTSTATLSVPTGDGHAAIDAGSGTLGAHRNCLPSRDEEGATGPDCSNSRGPFACPNYTLARVCA